MERRFVNLALIAALAETSACTTLKPVYVEPSPTISPPAATFTPFQPEYPTAQTETPQVRKVEDLFKLGSFNLGKKFTLETTPELMLAVGFSKPDTILYTADFPLPIIVPTFATEEQRAIFDEARSNNSDGNPYYVILTEKPNHLFLAFHSLQTTSPGDL